MLQVQVYINTYKSSKKLNEPNIRCKCEGFIKNKINLFKILIQMFDFKREEIILKILVTWKIMLIGVSIKN